MIPADEVVEGRRVRLLRDIDRRRVGDCGVIKRTRWGDHWGVVFDKERGWDMESVVVTASVGRGEVSILDLCELIYTPAETVALGMIRMVYADPDPDAADDSTTYLLDGWMPAAARWLPEPYRTGAPFILEGLIVRCIGTVGLGPKVRYLLAEIEGEPI